MSQRQSGYKRIKRDAYQTPEWVTLALEPHLQVSTNKALTKVWEPAAGEGKMASVLRDAGYKVVATDIGRTTKIVTGNWDFLTTRAPLNSFDWIITNPPYSHAEQFIEHALFMAPRVAMLLRCDFDSAQGRGYLFKNNKYFTKKIVLTKRIRWIENSKGSPSFNHAWYIWSKHNDGLPTIRYAP
jgi:hypothetical protein